MSVIVHIPVLWRQETGGERMAEFPAGSLLEVLGVLVARFPALATHLWDPKGEVNPALHFFVNQESVRYLEGLATPLQEGDEIDIITMISGGNHHMFIEEITNVTWVYGRIIECRPDLTQGGGGKPGGK